LASRNLKNLQAAQAKPVAQPHGQETASSKDRETPDQAVPTAEHQAKETPRNPSSQSSFAIRKAIHAADGRAPGTAASEPILRLEVNAKGEAVLIERVDTPRRRYEKNRSS
jgi:hypothetical protein